MGGRTFFLIGCVDDVHGSISGYSCCKCTYSLSALRVDDDNDDLFTFILLLTLLSSNYGNVRNAVVASAGHARKPPWQPSGIGLMFHSSSDSETNIKQSTLSFSASHRKNDIVAR